MGTNDRNRTLLKWTEGGIASIKELTISAMEERIPERRRDGVKWDRRLWMIAFIAFVVCSFL
jgi:hypothetical protein